MGILGKAGKVVCGGLAVACVCYGISCIFTNTEKKVDAIVEVKDWNVHPENEGKMVMMKGKLTYNNTILEDPDVGVRVKTPILKRITEMYQYYPDGSNQKSTMRSGWKTTRIANFKDLHKREYSNPVFPIDVPKSKDFAVDLTMNQGNLKIDAEFVKVLSYGKYVNFKDTYKDNIKNVSKLPTVKLPKGFVNTGNSYYKPYDGRDPFFYNKFTRGFKNSKVGDVRIYYQAFKWREDLPEFTVVGLQKDGKLLKQADSFFFDYPVTDKEQFGQEVKSQNHWAMVGALGLGVILAAIAYFI